MPEEDSYITEAPRKETFLEKFCYPYTVEGYFQNLKENALYAVGVTVSTGLLFLTAEIGIGLLEKICTQEDVPNKPAPEMIQYDSK